MRPHGEERAGEAPASRHRTLKARVSNHEVASSFETHYQIGKCRFDNAPQDEVAVSLGKIRMRKVEIISRNLVFDDFFKIEEARLRFERYDGTMSEPVRRLNFERGDSVAALLVDAQARLVHLTEQFKYPAYDKGGGWLIDVVAGMLGADEVPEDAVRREILEESGFETAALEAIATFFVSPGGTSERMFLFCAFVSEATRRSEGGGLAGEHEDIKVVTWPVDEFLGRIRRGELQDAKTLIAGYWLAQNLDRIIREHGMIGREAR
jgi:ADP-ribose pyrophosphatase